MATSRSKQLKPLPRRLRDFGRWEGVFGNLRGRPQTAAVVIILCLAAIAYVAYELNRQFQATAHWDKAQQLIADYDFLKAKEHLEECLKTWPKSAETEFVMARTCRRAGDFDVARVHLNRAEKLGWIQGYIDIELLLAQVQRGELQPAEDTLLRYLDARKHPDEIVILEALIKGYLHSYRLSEALHWLAAWIERYPNDWLPRFWRGQTRERVRHRGPAIEDFKVVLKLKPGHSEARLRLADLLLKNHPEEALPLYEEYSRAHPDDPSGLIGLARCQKYLGQIDTATATLDRFFANMKSKEHERVSGFVLRAELASEKDKPAEALEWIKRAEAMTPYEADIHFTMAKVLRQLGRGDEAAKYQAKEKQLREDQKELEKTTEEILAHPKKVDLRYKAGMIMMRNGQEKEGARWLESGLKEDPNHQETRKALAEYYRKAAKQAEAEGPRALKEQRQSGFPHLPGR